MPDRPRMVEPRLPRPSSRLHFPGAPIPARALAGLFVLAALLQFGLARLEGPLAQPHSRSLSGDEKRYVEVATAWAAGEPAELDPLWPPGYPAAVALILRCGGSLGWVVGLQMLSLLAAGVALGGLAREAGATLWIAWLAAALLVVDPEVAGFAWLFRPEALHLALLVTALLLATRLARQADGPPRTAGLLLLGTVVGLAIALKSLLLPFAPVLLIPLLRAPGWRRRLTRGWLVALPLVVVLTPVALFHHARSGTWTLGGSARFNLWVGLNDRALQSLAEDQAWAEYLSYRAGGATFAERQDALTKRLLDLVEVRGLPAIIAGQFPRQYFRLFDRESYFSAMLPPRGSRYLAGEGYRQAPPWLARLFGAGAAVLYVAILCCAPFGLVRLLRERRPGACWVAALLAYQLVLFYFLHVKSRYRLTLLPLLVLGAAWAVETVRRRRRQEGSPVSAFDLVLGGAGATLLLFFAYGAA